MELTQRKSNIELLRIFAIFAIIIHHFSAHGIFQYYQPNTTLLEHINNFITGFFIYGGKLGVDIFILITGYFMINSEFKLKHIFKIYFYLLFYSLLFLILAFATGSHEVPEKYFYSSVFPLIRNNYWFISNYIYLYFLIPFLNKFIKSLNKKEAFCLLTVLGTAFYIIPIFSKELLISGQLGCFIYIYCLGAFIRLNIFKNLCDNKLLKRLTIFSVLFISFYKLSYIIPFDKIAQLRSSDYSEINSIFILIPAIYCFNFFNSLNIKYNKYVNSIASSVLGIYLIHDNNFVRMYIWKKLAVFLNINSVYYILIIILISLTVFLVCLTAHKIITFIMEKHINKLADYLQDKLIPIYEKFISKLENN